MEGCSKVEWGIVGVVIPVAEAEEMVDEAAIEEAVGILVGEAVLMEVGVTVVAGMGVALTVGIVMVIGWEIAVMTGTGHPMGVGMETRTEAETEAAVIAGVPAGRGHTVAAGAAATTGTVMTGVESVVDPHPVGGHTLLAEDGAEDDENNSNSYELSRCCGENFLKTVF